MTLVGGIITASAFILFLEYPLSRLEAGLPVHGVGFVLGEYLCLRRAFAAEPQRQVNRPSAPELIRTTNSTARQSGNAIRVEHKCSGCGVVDDAVAAS